MKYIKLTACIISAIVSSKGDVINIDHIRYIDKAESGTAIIYQYYHPSVIHSDWHIDKVVDSIINSLEQECNKI